MSLLFSTETLFTNDSIELLTKQNDKNKKIIYELKRENAKLYTYNQVRDMIDVKTKSLEEVVKQLEAKIAKYDENINYFSKQATDVSTFGLEENVIHVIDGWCALRDGFL